MDYPDAVPPHFGLGRFKAHRLNWNDQHRQMYSIFHTDRRIELVVHTTPVGYAEWFVTYEAEDARGDFEYQTVGFLLAVDVERFIFWLLGDIKLLADGETFEIMAALVGPAAAFNGVRL